jgi:hypothetical protein
MEPQSGLDPLRGDGASGARVRLSPALMLSENMSLQSLARSSRGVGVTDLREALEGRSSMSNPNLAKAPSVSTLDHGSTHLGGEAYRLRPTRSRPEKKARNDPKEVRDVLNKLRIGKSALGSGALLKASFPTLQSPKLEARCVRSDLTPLSAAF